MTRTSRIRWLGVPFVALAMIALPLSAWAARVTPETYEGNRTCGSFNSNWVELYKAEIGDPNGSAAGVTWNVRDGSGGQTVDWTSDRPLVAVAVKGGNIGGNLYRYGPGVTSDSGLHTPMNPSGKWADVSHVSFCVEPEPEPGTLVVHKVTEPSGADETFGFAMAIPDGDPWTVSLMDGEHASVEVDAGWYSVIESPAEGWTLASVSCTGEYELVDNGVAVYVEEEGFVECTFTNTGEEEPETGRVVIGKMTEPPTPGVSFSFESDIPRRGGLFAPVLEHAESDGVQVEPGVYTVDEILPDGWELTGIRCNDEETVITETGVVVDVDPGELVRCVFTNEPLPEPEPGTVSITKVTEPEDDEAWFQFTSSVMDGDELWEPVLMDGETATIDVAAGSYTVAEVEKAGWELLSVECDGAAEIVDGMVTLDVGEGDTVSCTFTNEPTEEEVPAAIVLTKMIDPAGSDEAFDFETNVPDGGDFWAPSLGHDETETMEVEPGMYTIDEVASEDWQIQGIVCDDPESTIGDEGVVLDVDEGETVSCTFTNEPVPPELGAIGDFVWNDANADGLQGSTEVGVEGVVVKLFEVTNYMACGADVFAPTCADLLADDDTELVDLTMTDDDGLYIFEDVPAGLYVVEFSNLPEDFEFTEPFMGDHELDSDALVESGRTPVMELAEGERDLDCDAGVFLEKVSAKQPGTTTTTTAGATTTSTTEPVILPFTGAASAESGVAAALLVLVGSILVAGAGLVRRFNT